MEIHIKIAGWLMLLLALMHAVFPRYLNWKIELKSLSVINRQVMYVHSFFIAFLILMLGLLCIFSSHDLITTTLGHRILTGLAIFWTTRLAFQFLVYSSATWKGKKPETAVHFVFAFLWSYFAMVFIIAAW